MASTRDLMRVNYRTWRELPDAEEACEEIAHGEPAGYAVCIEAGSEENERRGIVRVYWATFEHGPAGQGSNVVFDAVDTMAREWGETHDWCEIKYEAGPPEEELS